MAQGALKLQKVKIGGPNKFVFFIQGKIFQVYKKLGSIGGSYNLFRTFNFDLLGINRKYIFQTRVLKKGSTAGSGNYHMK